MILLKTNEAEAYLSECWNSTESSMFMQWIRVLTQLERERKELPSIDIWSESTKCIQALKRMPHHRAEYVPLLYNKLLSDCAFIQNGKQEPLKRTAEEAKATAELVFAVTAIRLVNYIKPGHEHDPLAEPDAIINGIIDCIGDDVFNNYSDFYFKHKIDGYGKKIKIDQYDIMADKSFDDELVTQKQKESKQLTTTIENHLLPIKDIIGTEYYENLIKVFSIIIDNPDDSLLLSLKRVKPNKNDWGINKTMVLNIVAMFVHIEGIKTNNNQLNNAIGGNNNTPYLVWKEPDDSDHTSFGMSKEAYKKVREIIENL